MTDKSAKMLERVRALLAKADSTNFEEEAKAFRDKADQLMTAHAIETWQVQAAQDGVGARPKPSHRMVNIAWYWSDSAVKEPLWSLMQSVASHCRVKLVSHVVRDRHLPVVGLDADIDYFDMLFTSLMFQLGRQLEPTYDSNLTEAENIAVFKEAGLPWREIAKLIGRPEFVVTEDKYNSRTGYTEKVTKVKDGGYMGRVYKKYCDDNGIKNITANPKSYQRNFATGFAIGVREQLREQVKTAEDTHGSGMELVLRDIREVINDYVHEEFGADKRVVKYQRDTRKTDMAAVSGGVKAGKRADVSGHPNRRVGNRKQIGQG